MQQFSPAEPTLVSVDVVLFTLAAEPAGGPLGLRVLLVRRSRPPYAGAWSLPASRLAARQSLEEAAAKAIGRVDPRADVYLEQLYTFGEPDRDPRGRSVTVAYYAVVRPDQVQVPAVAEPVTGWFSADDLPSLAFDHAHIVNYARWRLRNKIEYTDMAFQVLPEAFTLTRLRQVYEAILGEQLDKRNFNRKVLSSGLLVDTGVQQGGRAHRPARLYAFQPRPVQPGPRPDAAPGDDA